MMMRHKDRNAHIDVHIYLGACIGRAIEVYSFSSHPFFLSHQPTGS